MAFIYNRYDDNVAPNATVSVNTGTEDTGYLSANIKDRDPAKPAKLTGVAGSWVFDFGAAQRVDVAALVHHNLDAGLSVKLQGNATNVWTAPTLDASFTIPALPEDNYVLCPWMDVTTQGGYSTSGFRYWRLLVGTNTSAVAIGDVWLGKTKRTLSWVQYGIEFADASPIIEHRTDFLVSHIYGFGVRVRKVAGEVRMTNTLRTELVSWVRANAGRARASLVIPDSDINDAMMMRFQSTDFAWVRSLPNLNYHSLALEELSRGLAL